MLHLHHRTKLQLQLQLQIYLLSDLETINISLGLFSLRCETVILKYSNDLNDTR